MHYTPTLDDACHVLHLLDVIPRPYGDNEGDPINSGSVYHLLSKRSTALSLAYLSCSWDGGIRNRITGTH
jgi:hypothetical protein